MQKSKAVSDNPITPLTRVLVLDRPRHLAWNINAMIAIQEATGQNVLNPVSLVRFLGITPVVTPDGAEGEKSKFRVQTDLKNLRAAVWACCRTEDPEVTEEFIGSFLCRHDIILEAQRVVLELTSAAMPEREDSPERPTDAGGAPADAEQDTTS